MAATTEQLRKVLQQLHDEARAEEDKQGELLAWLNDERNAASYRLHQAGAVREHAGALLSRLPPAPETA